MRISFRLRDLTREPEGVPGVQYDPEANVLVVEALDGEVAAINMAGFDFTLHEKCELAPTVVNNITQGEIGTFDGVQLSMKQLVELVDAARREA